MAENQPTVVTSSFPKLHPSVITTPPSKSSDTPSHCLDSPSPDPTSRPQGIHEKPDQSHFCGPTPSAPPSQMSQASLQSIRLLLCSGCLLGCWCMSPGGLSHHPDPPGTHRYRCSMNDECVNEQMLCPALKNRAAPTMSLLCQFPLAVWDFCVYVCAHMRAKSCPTLRPHGL